jgi:hypothetical protein
MSAEKEAAETTEIAEPPKRKRGQRGPDKKPRKPGTGKFLKEAAKTDVNEEYNRKEIAFILEVTPKSKPDFNDIEEMDRRFTHYLETCAKYGKRVGNMTAYSAIGVSVDNVSDWTAPNAKNKDRKQFFEYVKSVCATYREGLMQDSKVHPAVGIFWQKNYDGLKDQKESIQVAINPLGEQKDAKSLEQKYMANAALVEPAKAIDAEFVEREVEKEKV